MIRTTRTASASGDIASAVGDTREMGRGSDVQTTVLIPVWNDYVGWLEQAVVSLTGQNVATRIVVVDNASEVKLPELPGVCVVTSRRRLTLGAARNLGLAEVTTPYVVVWDADDTILPGTLGFLEGAMTADPRLAAYGTAIIEEPSGRRHRWPRPWITTVARRPALLALLDCIWSLYPTTGAT